MLEKSIQRGCYNSLILGDAAEYLENVTPSSVDAVIAADVFIYIGDLKKIFQLAFNALKSENGFLIFTVEEMPRNILNGILDPVLVNPLKKFLVDEEENENVSKTDDTLNDEEVLPTVAESEDITEEDFRLLDCGRFGHTEKYISKISKEIGFRILSAKRDVIRLQAQVPVKSITFVLCKV